MLSVRVLIAEPWQLLRGAFVALLGREDDIDVVADVERIDQLVRVALSVRPDVAVIDIDGYGEDGLDRVSELSERLPECPTLVLSCRNTPAVMQSALCAKARGFLVKNAPADGLAESIRRVGRGELAVDPRLAVAALNVTSNPLTPRELEILQIAANGATVAEISARLYLSIGTVRNYLSGIIRKTGGRNRIDAIRIASDAGWLWTKSA